MKRGVRDDPRLLHCTGHREAGLRSNVLSRARGQSDIQNGAGWHGDILGRAERQSDTQGIITAIKSWSLNSFALFAHS